MLCSLYLAASVVDNLISICCLAVVVFCGYYSYWYYALGGPVLPCLMSFVPEERGVSLCPAAVSGSLSVVDMLLQP